MKNLKWDTREIQVGYYEYSEIRKDYYYLGIGCNQKSSWSNGIN